MEGGVCLNTGDTNSSIELEPKQDNVSKNNDTQTYIHMYIHMYILYTYMYVYV